MTRRAAASAEDFRQLAGQEVELAKEAISNEVRAQHFAMAEYYTRLADSLMKQNRQKDE